MKAPSITRQCLMWLFRKEQLMLILLIAVVGASSVGVIYSSFMTRRLYAEIQELQAQEDEIDSEYGKLLLEKSAWANYVRVEQVSREELNMISPLTEDMVLVGNDADG